MAGIQNTPKGLRIQFRVPGGSRQTLWLHDMNRRQAEQCRHHIERLLVHLRTRCPLEAETALWVSGISDEFHRRLAKKGLVSPREQHTTTLKQLLDAVMKNTPVKATTLTTYNQTVQSLLGYFKPDRLVASINPLEAAAWRQSMVDAGKAEATISKRVKTARSFFRAGITWKMLSENPFTSVKAGSQANRGRMHQVTLEHTRKVLDACPDTEWRLRVVLSRFGGLRCPSEHLALRWSDVDWANKRLTVRSRKTEHHAGRDFRSVPLFPVVERFLLEAYHQAEVGAEWVFPNRRQSNANLRTQFKRIIERAGLEPWQKLFQNLRSTRQTELTDSTATHLVCGWMGNTTSVAVNHYLQATDEHFAKAIEWGQKELAQIVTPQGGETGGNRSTPQRPAPSKTLETQPVATGCVSSRDEQVTPMGFEPMSHP
jgi:integrase